MNQDAMYSFFRHAFMEIGQEVEGEPEGLFDEHPVNVYADTLVQDLFDTDKLAPAPEAVIVLNVWMYIVHQLYEISRACQRGDDNTNSDMQKALDIAAALWVGTGQEAKDNDTGNMLYNLAEKAAADFSQEVEGEAIVNNRFLGSLEDIKLAIELGACHSETTSYVELRALIRKIIGYMTVPLVQTLIHHVMQEATGGTSDFIEMYFLSFAPRVQTCLPTVFSAMLDIFVRQDFKDMQEEAAINLVQSVYSCLEITCAQVGNYRTGEVPTCDDTIDIQSFAFAGYPLNFDARPVRQTVYSVC